ncbi:MAG: hypothetical protein ACTSP9_01760 [Promethearchaeota archaeon]
MVKTEEKDYWNKEEIGERLKWLTVSICGINIMMTIGMIFFFVYINPFPLLSVTVGILIGLLGVRFSKKYKKKK